MRTFLFVSSILSAGCYGAHRDGDPVAAEPDTTPDDPVEPDDGTSDPPVDPPVQVDSICAGDGVFDFEIRGEGLDAWEGARVVASALENDWTTEDLEPRRPVLLAARIAGGRFSLSCERSLTENYGYPSYAVFVDVDGDAGCSAGDVSFGMQFYGWNASVEEDVEATDFRPIGANASPPIGAEAEDFCSGYFE